MPIKMTLAGANPNFPCEVMGNTPLEVWKAAASMVGLISVRKCGACDSENIRPDVRHVKTDKNDFDSYGWRCDSCGSSLKFGVNKEGGGMFLRWDEEWFVPEKKEESKTEPAI